MNVRLDPKCPVAGCNNARAVGRMACDAHVEPSDPPWGFVTRLPDGPVTTKPQLRRVK